MASSEITVTIETTENDSQRIFRFSTDISEHTIRFADIEDTATSPLANKIFGFPWTESVTISKDSVTIEKQDWVEWEVLQQPLAGLLKEHLDLNLPIFAKPTATVEGEGRKFKVRFEETPNPEAMKFIIDQDIADTPLEYHDLESAKDSPLAEKIFSLPWVLSVFIGRNFITITKQDWAEWASLCEPMSQLLGEQLNAGTRVQPLDGQTDIQDDDSEDVRKIKKILNEEIRPAVAQDGGDIVFQSFENDILYLFMKGACSGCPSATATLKMGIEGRIKEVIPHLKDVVAV